MPLRALIRGGVVMPLPLRPLKGGGVVMSVRSENPHFVEFWLGIGIRGQVPPDDHVLLELTLGLHFDKISWIRIFSNPYI